MKLPILALSWRVSRHGQAGGHARRTSRVRGLPELGGELPVALLAEQIETPGPGQIWVASATPTQLDPPAATGTARLELRDRSINPGASPNQSYPERIRQTIG